ncbi:MAG: RsmB/NOP family class I SAM-dependent RNA methyltransferase [Burkholderiales bacterium]
MNIHRKLLDAATQALGIALKFEQPADAVLSQYFRQHHALGQRDRAFIAEAVFGVLRHKLVLEQLTEDGNARLLVLGWIARFSSLKLADVSPALKSAEAETVDQLKGISLDALPVAVRAELPDWVYERLIANMSEAEILELGRALQEPAPLDLRVNTLQSDRPRVLRALAERGIEAQETVHSPVGVRISNKTALNREPIFLEGAVEVQDEGSQLVGYLVAPRRNDLVVDFCSGAGGKALMLGAMMHSQGRVYAFDVSPARLSRLKPRLKRSGLSNLHPHLLRSEHDPKVKRLAGKIDRVLVDAPCSGLGTVRRNPDLKWRQSPDSVAELCEKQTSILRAASTLVKTGGRLVYATCSLLREENEEIVDSFLEAHPEFRALDCGEILRQHGIEIDMPGRMRLWPHLHGTDGFFGAAFERSRVDLAPHVSGR